MRFKCNSCGQAFNFKQEIRCCPICTSTNIERTGKANALKMLNEYNDLSSQMEVLMEKYIPLYLEAERIRSTLRQYKVRGLITAEEMPPKQRVNITAMLSDYRKNRKGE